MTARRLACIFEHLLTWLKDTLSNW